jgi:subtilisin family serine protease
MYEEKIMKKVTTALLLTFVLVLSTIGAAGASPSFQDVTSTVDGYSTWDSDMINIENVTQTGAGVYVAVLDTGMVPNWKDYFPTARVATELGTGFDQPVSFSPGKDACRLDVEVGQLHQTTWVGSTGSTHGTHVASTILGYFYRSNTDAAQGFALPPIMVRGIAPEVTVIPVKVLADYQIPALPNCTNPGPVAAQNAVFGTDAMVAAGINYVTDLAIAGYRPMVINMSLGGSALDAVEKEALDRAIANGVIVVASAGNEGEAGMGYPGAYAPVISAGSVGWTKEWLYPGDGPRYRMWWLQYPEAPIPAGSGDVADPTVAEDVYLSDFSSRAYTGSGQQLDVLAPGSWVRGPFGGDPGYNHLPWWSKGLGDLFGRNSGNFYYVGGTSMASPHVASAAALLLQVNPNLTQAQVESTLKSTALKIPNKGSQYIYDFDHFATISWDTKCGRIACDPVGAGLLQVDKAISAVP